MSPQQIGPPSSVVVTQARKQDSVRYYIDGEHLRTVAEITYETKKTCIKYTLGDGQYPNIHAL